MTEICGDCVNWRCDDALHLVGHCTVNRMQRFHGERCVTCTKYAPRFIFDTDYQKEEGDKDDK